MRTSIFIFSLVGICMVFSSCSKKKTGCTDPGAHNFDSKAQIDDGSCETCSDGIKNGNEVTVDCGGGCPNVCWVTTQSPTTKDLQSAHFIDKDRGWICGANGAMFRTKDGGTTWTDLSLNTSWFLSHIFFIDQFEGWAIAYDILVDSAYLIETCDGGGSWNINNQSGYYYFADVEFINTSTGYAVAQYGWLSNQQASVVYKTIDGGISWQTDTLNTAFLSLFVVDANTVWLSGDNGDIFHTTDGALTWNQNNRSTTMMLTDIHINGNTGVAPSSQYAISYSSNNGIDWDTFVEYSASFSSVFLINQNECWIVGDYFFNNERGIIMYSDDGGQSWIHQFPETGTVSYELRDVFFPDQSHGWIVGYNGTIIRRGY